MTTTTAATTKAAAQTKPQDRMLRIALKVDAIASGVSGLGCVALGKLNADLYGLPTEVTMPAGILLLAFAGFVWFAATRSQVKPGAVWAIIAINVIWVIGSVAALVAGWLPLTTLGAVYVGLQAAAVALFAEFEYMGLRRSRRG